MPKRKRLKSIRPNCIESEKENQIINCMKFFQFD